MHYSKFRRPMSAEGRLRSSEDVRRMTALTLEADITGSRLVISQTRQQRPSPPFAQRTLWNVRATMTAYSALMFAARITLPHFSVSSAMCLPKSLGEPGSTVPPRSATRQRAATRIDAPNPTHDHCGELRRPSTTIGRQAEVIRDASNRHSVRPTGAWDVVYEGRIST